MRAKLKTRDEIRKHVENEIQPWTADSDGKWLHGTADETGLSRPPGLEVFDLPFDLSYSHGYVIPGC